jgi:acetyl-CoA acetyltransferase
MTFVEDRAVITGVGQSQLGRKIGRDGLDLACEAVTRAIADAGLTPDDIDGVASYPGPAAAEVGFVGASTHDIRNALGLKTTWYTSGLETAGQAGTMMDACAAVAGGRATHVVCFRSVWEATAQAKLGRAASITANATNARVAGHGVWRMSYGAASAANWISMYAQRYMHDFGLKREQLGNIAINARRNAALNPNAIYNQPITMDDYLNARMISYPFGLLDCDVPADGATAIIVSRREASKDLRRPPISIEAAGTAMYERHSWDQRKDLTTMTAHDCADAMWATTKMTPADVDFATLYDGFTYLTLQWIDAFGFAKHGEAGHFMEDLDRFSKDGDFPINTHGGQLSSGRMHGYGFLHEACVQLWGDAGERQITKDIQVAAVGIGGGPEGGCMLLRRDS